MTTTAPIPPASTDLAANTRAPVFQRVTGRGVGGIATVVLDGDEVLLRFEPHFSSKRKLSLEPGALQFGRIVDAAGRVIDEAVVAAIDLNQSWTGNTQLEVSCHGGEGSVAALEAVLQAAGFRAARLTELLERAHLHGKLSLIAVEARLRLAAAVTARQAEFLLQHTTLQSTWERHGFDMALGLREKRIDWREPLVTAADEALAHAEPALKLLQSHDVAIIGPVNAGKSTLANALARATKHIVSALPGTTRDKLDTPLDIRGLNVVLSDTAGLRSAADAIEEEGQRRALEAAKQASLRLVVLDGSHAPADADVELLKDMVVLGQTLLVLNKQDLGLDATAAGLGFVAGREPVALSAQTGAGLEELESALETVLLGGTLQSSNAAFTWRHIERLRELRERLVAGEHGMDVFVHLRKFVGTRPDAEELARVIAESAAVTNPEGSHPLAGG